LLCQFRQLLLLLLLWVMELAGQALFSSMVQMPVLLLLVVKLWLLSGPVQMDQNQSATGKGLVTCGGAAAAAVGGDVAVKVKSMTLPMTQMTLTTAQSRLI
jgi:hypothetical protein